MQDILQAPFLREICAMTDNMYRLGWDERNGGNISYRLMEDEIAPYPELASVKRRMELDFCLPELAGQIFLVTGSGRYFKNVAGNPAENLGIFRLSAEGNVAEILWGYENGGRPTSELATHLMNHAKRQKTDPQQRVVMHCHPANLLAMTFVHELDERAFSRTLWQMCTECIVVFPEGVGILPWMLCGTPDIGYATAEKIGDVRVVIWAAHGVFGVGNTLDETFGLIETVEKAAEIYMKIGTRPILQSITDEELAKLADAFGLTPRAGYLQIEK